MSTYNRVKEIGGINPLDEERLRTAGIYSVGALLQKGANRYGRAEIARVTGIDGMLIEKWLNRAMFFRLDGISGEHIEVLARCGVHSVAELSRCEPTALYVLAIDAGAGFGLSLTQPEITDWIQAAGAVTLAAERRM